MPGGRPYGRRPRFITGVMYVPKLVGDEGDDEISRVLRENAASMREIAAADVSARSDSGEGQQPPQAFDVAPDVGAAATRREIS